MHVAHVIWIAVSIVAAAACIITANVMFYQILDEVNAHKRKSMGIWAGVGFALLLLTFLSGFLLD